MQNACQKLRWSKDYSIVSRDATRYGKSWENCFCDEKKNNDSRERVDKEVKKQSRFVVGYQLFFILLCFNEYVSTLLALIYIKQSRDVYIRGRVYYYNANSTIKGIPA